MGEVATTIDLDTLPPIFRECCADMSSRYTLDAPWVQDGFIYALDGRILVRMPAPEGAQNTTEPVPPMDKLGLGEDRWESDPIADFTLPEPEIIACRVCAGSGKAVRECVECGGYGEKECSRCGHTNECDECRGKGTIRVNDGEHCNCCHGTGKAENAEQPIEVEDGLFLRRDYLGILLRAGARIHRYNPGDDGRPTNGPVRFYGDGFDGLLMPMNPVDRAAKAVR